MTTCFADCWYEYSLSGIFPGGAIDHPISTCAGDLATFFLCYASIAMYSTRGVIASFYNRGDSFN